MSSARSSSRALPLELPAVCLASVDPGTRCVVHSIDASTPAGQRLLDLGFVPGSRLRVLRRAPLGDPVVYELRGTRICLRRSEALKVQVQVRSAPS
jgi:Fe2+ transport system protein FeoA